MREIKFRAWNNSKAVQRMLEWEFIRALPMEQLFAPHLILMQFTGLKDKNGVEIFEGDIVRYDGRDTPYVVRFNERLARLDTGELGYEYPLFVEKDMVEVIGNIYENPEVVKETA